jgi:hypothetical protein
VHGERLYLLYSLLPHRLLAVPPLELDVADDRASPLSPHGIVTCEVVADSSVEDTVSRCRAWGVPTSVLLPDGERRSLACPEFRGGTQAVRCIGAHGPCLVGVGHFRSSADYYSAAFELAPEPPFLLRRLGSAWKLEGAKIEYVSGLRVGPEGNLVASYGVDDCASCEVALSYDELFAPR